MENLFNLLQRFSGALLFVVLQVICIFLIIRFNSHQNNIYFSTVSSYRNLLFDITDDGWDYYYMPSTVDSVAKKNAELYNQLALTKFNNIIEVDTSESADIRQQYIFVEANVINNSIRGPSNYITFNRGTRHGIKKHSGVVSNNGIVGIVVGVSKNYSVAMSILHRDSRVSTKLKGTREYFGSLIWRGYDASRMSLIDIPKHAQVSKGDTIQTSGYSTFFPKGINVGVVDKIVEDSGSGYLDISISLFEDLSCIQYVYIVTNIMQEEQLSLENAVINE